VTPGDEVARAVESIRATRRELEFLRGLVGARARLRGVLDVPGLRALQRRVNRALHPDRGGDAELLGELNALLDGLVRGLS